MSSNKCQVCSKLSHGLHFGAITCRACAAYFRRAILKKYDQLECTNGDGKCGKHSVSCKKCRLEKCLKAGMTDHRVQLGRDPMSSTVKQIPITLQSFVGRPSFILSCDPETGNRSKIDFSKLITKAENILSSTTEIYLGMNTLNQLTNALNQPKNTSSTPQIYQRIGKNEVLKIWETHFLQVARWLTHCDKFQECPLNMRIEFLKTVWLTWSFFYTNVMTVDRKVKEEAYLWDDCVVDLKQHEMDLSWFSDENYSGLMDQFFASALADELMSLRPTPQETTYMLSVFSFRHAARVFRDDFETLCETMIQTMANDLHNYYINEVKMRRYASRMTKMMKIVYILERDIHARVEKFALARMFDVIKVDFSHPEVIYGRI